MMLLRRSDSRSTICSRSRSSGLKLGASDNMLTEPAMEVRIADFVGDSSGQAAYGGQAILHAHLAFQAANLGEVVKGVDKSQITARAHVERGNHNAKSFAEAVASHVADFGIAAAAAEVRQRILKEIGHGARLRKSGAVVGRRD